MKNKMMCLAGAVLALTQFATASIIDSTTRDGGFEDFANNWAVGAFNSPAGDSESTTVHSGAAALSIAEGKGAYQNTEYTVAVGDAFDLSFFWTSRWGLESSDEVGYRLFTTDDNTTSGAVSEILAGTVSGKSGNDKVADYEPEVTLTSSVVTDASVGQQLWVEFYSVNLDSSDYARVDDVTLSVATIPEPATLGMLGVGALGLLFARRRYSK